MKKIDGVEYFDIFETGVRLHHNFTETQLLKHLDSGELVGKKIDNVWYVNQEEIDKFYEKTVLKDVQLTEKHTIDLRNLKLTGRTLDIGGGGEGTIGLLAPEQVIAIDPNERELIEAPGDFLKIVMNAEDLKFLSETFDTVTSFFTMMYIPLSDHEKVFKEIYRVLKPNGFLLLWDMRIPKQFNKDKMVYAINLEINLGTKIITTGFGTRWNKVVTIEHYLDLAKEIGFQQVSQEINGESFFIKFKKE